MTERLSRRGFLKLCELAAGATALAACRVQLQEGDELPSSSVGSGPRLETEEVKKEPSKPPYYQVEIGKDGITTAEEAISEAYKNSLIASSFSPEEVARQKDLWRVLLPNLDIVIVSEKFGVEVFCDVRSFGSIAGGNDERRYPNGATVMISAHPEREHGLGDRVRLLRLRGSKIRIFGWVADPSRPGGGSVKEITNNLNDVRIIGVYGDKLGINPERTP